MWVSRCGESVGELQMTDAYAANRSYPARETTRPATTPAATPRPALPARPPQLPRPSRGDPAAPLRRRIRWAYGSPS